jgi:hypothetical protein
MREQESAALAAQEQQNKAEVLARRSSEEHTEGSGGGAHNTEDADVPALVREEDYAAMAAPARTSRRSAPRNATR